MRALKTLVIVMGIAIVAGTAVLVTLIVERGGRLAADGPSASTAAPPVSGRLALPAGARVLETRLDGARIALRAALADGTQALFIFDAASARLIRRLDIAPETGTP